jgi:hypothetical protein
VGPPNFSALATHVLPTIPAGVVLSGTAANVIFNFSVPQGTTGGSGSVTTINTGTGLSGGGSAGTVTVQLNAPLTVAQSGTNTTSLAQTTVNAGFLLSNGSSNTGPVVAMQGFSIPSGSSNNHTLMGRYAHTGGGITSAWLNLLRSRGTIASPAAVANSDSLGAFAMGGYYSGTAFSYEQTGMYTHATQAWSSGARGSELRFKTTANGSNAMRDVTVMQQDGDTTFYGTLQVNGAVYLTAPGNTHANLTHTVSGVRNWTTYVDLGGGFGLWDGIAQVVRLHLNLNGVAYIHSHWGGWGDGANWDAWPNGYWAVQYHVRGQLSSEHLKRDIEPAPDSLGKIMQLHPVDYRWKREGADGPLHRGFLAHQVREVMGEGFAGYYRDRTTGKESLCYEDLVGVLWHGTQELKTRYDRLGARIAALEDS